MRLMGMYEVSANVPNMTQAATKYNFSNFSWSSITIKNYTSDAGVKLMDISSIGTSPSDGLTVTITLHVSSEKVNGTYSGPWGFKWDLDMNGPTWSLSPPSQSSMRIVQVYFNSLGGSNTQNSSSLMQGPTQLGWAPTVLVDGVPSNLTFAANETRFVNLSPSFASVSKELNHDSALDLACTKQVVAFDIPYWNTSMNWDPSVAIDNGLATTMYQNYVDGSSSTPTTSAASAGAKARM
ncbi:hypothetical protein HDU91_006419, partial [Kappamyces sp. JEL0680]